ncbi:site-specific integrase [Pseudomonas sp. 5Ae-yellow]|uniref:site-specific integrase n=1 Tax=Pseudomonas sp. 5Ae-yellow TaxID=2759848 RepID=UPI0028735BA4|nr:site-specific integrase [Pseudomonas sp. 5Ae-yellow]
MENRMFKAKNISEAGPQTTSIFVARDGYEVDFNGASWKLNKDTSFLVSKASRFLSERMYRTFKEVLVTYAKNYSPAYVAALHDCSVSYFRATETLPPFSVESLISYRGQLGREGEPELACLRTLVRKWHALGFEGVPEEAISLLKKWRLSGGDRGKPVRSMCPKRGPLSDMEMDTVITGLTEAYQAGSISTTEIALVMSLIMTGRRPAQITALKIRDLSSSSGQYYLNVPRAKQRNEGGWRNTFKQVPIVEDLWFLLCMQADLVYGELQKLAPGLAPELRQNLPIFPNLSALNRSEDIVADLNSDKMHMSVAVLQKTMVQVAQKITAISERTGEPIVMNAYRFRYTLGTNLGREGKGESVIAEALDHADTQHTGVYVKNLPEIVERLDEATAYYLAPIAQAFRGVIVKSEKEARRGSDISSRVSNGDENLGNCGSYGFCGALGPIACYTCNQFQPWIDGPHEAVLAHLLQERDRVLDVTQDLKIASTNDRLILAVTDVITRCNN